MSTFTALNLEPEDTIEQEVDDSREIQIEEALKLYQNALKLHSQGPSFIEDAAEAYQALFNSEIFKYPEAASEFSKEEIGAGGDRASAVTSEAATFVPTAATDGSPNSLLQIIYLSYKSYGQFILDSLRKKAASPVNFTAQESAIVGAGGKALKSFADALERDDSDLDLWRKAARVGSILSSHRVLRFCLESVLVTDEENSYDVSDLLGLDELSAFEDLKQELKLLEDDLSRLQVPKVDTKLTIATALKNRMDPYPFLPRPSKELEYDGDWKRPYAFRPERKRVEAASRTWAGIGMSIYRFLLDQSNGIVSSPGDAITIEVPSSTLAVDRDEHAQAMDLDEAPKDSIEVNLDQAPTASGENGKDAIARDTEDKVQEKGFTNGSIHGTPDTIEEQVAAQLTNGIAETLEREEHVKVDQNETADEVMETPILSLPTRKRTSTSAGQDDTNEGGRARSKRLRARESIVEAVVQEEDIKFDMSKYYEDQLIELSQADDNVFTALEEILEPLGINEMSHLREFRQPNADSAQALAIQPATSTSTVKAMLDLQAALTSWNEAKGQAFLVSDGANDLDGTGSSRDVGLALFQEHTKSSVPQAPPTSNAEDDEGIVELLQGINDNWTTSEASALQWLEALMMPKSALAHGTASTFTESSYQRAPWPSTLKDLVVNMIILEDGVLFREFDARARDLERRVLSAFTTVDGFQLSKEELNHVQMAQTIFELHLDIYYAITNPSSEVDKTTRIQQKDRLLRWNTLAGEFINYYAQQSEVDLKNGLAIRFLYAATLHAIKAEDATQEHIMLCLRDLQYMLERAGNIMIALPNNGAMPEISAAAVSQEMSRLSTLDFFMAMFNNDDSNPVLIIESLEPILDTASKDTKRLDINGDAEEIDSGSEPAHLLVTPQAQELVRFLEQGSASLTLFLWRRLRDAYKTIDYTPKIVSCYLRSLEIVMNELLSSSHQELQEEQRQLATLKWIRYLDDLMIKLMPLVLTGTNAFDCVDADHLKDSLTAVVRLGSILHAFVAHEDTARVGQISSPIAKSTSSNKAFEKVKDKLRDMQMRLWVLLYTLIRDGISQHQDLFPNGSEDRINYLRFVHNAMGARQYCKHSNKGFLKLAKQEFIATKHWQEYDADFAQVLFDLYGLKFGYGIGDQDHGCSLEPLDKKTAYQIIPFVMGQVNRISIKDVSKSEVKGTLEKLQQVMGSYKTTPALSFNKRIINQYLKSPIDPRELYSCLKGAGDLPTKPIKTDTAPIAESGWYLLQGQLALARFKSVKRVNPTPTDDLDTAATFFRQDLDHDIERWQSWYGLAQVNDAKIADDLLWTAEKINNQRGELATMQRHAIHCYAMAVSTSLRTTETTPETTDQLSDMYTAFAIRLYSSSREPLSMQAFSLDNYERHYSAETTQQMYKAKPFAEMKTYSVWNLATSLLRKALVDKPKKWINQYYLAKCLWKMFRYTGDPRTFRSKPGIDEILEVLVEGVQNVPPRKDNRNDPILEPHFKLVSIVHKLVRNGMLEPSKASEVLQVSQWAKKVHLSEEDDGWEPYVLQILKNLGQADKSNWHHRIIARAAHVIYDGNERDLAAALGAKHEFTQQVFTKTMTLQVWKPENERPGRHFVYTTRYVSFFIGILYQLNDRPNLDQLARRIRRKPGDYMNHSKLWEAVCNTYLQLLRKIGKIPQGLDQTVFGSMNQEDFAKKASRVEPWAHDPETSSPIIDILRDAIELKKLNNSLMKGTAFDDLIADAYTKAYETYYQEHPEPDPQIEQQDIHIPSAGLPASIVSSGQIDGSADSSASATPNAFPTARALLPASTVPPPVNSSTQTTADTTPSTTSAPSKPNRNRNVTRREMIRRAEALTSRTNTTQTSAPSKTPIQTPGKTSRPVVEIRTTPSSTTLADNDTIVDRNTPSSPKDNYNARKPSTAGVSPTGSVAGGDGDGDDGTGGNVADESGSELSDLDEEDEMDLDRKASVLFPGLMAARNRKDSASSSISGGLDEVNERGGSGAEDEEGDAGDGDDDVDLEDDNDEQQPVGQDRERNAEQGA